MNPLVEVIGENPGIVAVRETIGRLLQRPSGARLLPPLLIQGETGTGKGLLARAIHRVGPRANGPFVSVNCAAIPETLLEAEMFGFECGAFTDARQAKAGLFQTAHRGTLFLDEVGLLPEGLQSKFLTAIEEREVRRLGSTHSEAVDVWILTATSHDLASAMRERRFHDALYHRLAVMVLWLPPLRERGRDILVLAEHFLARACADYGLPPKALATDGQAALLGYHWPGNVRELSNVLERVALLSEGALVTAEMLGLPEAASAAPRTPAGAEEIIPLAEAMGSVEQQHLLEALQQTNWNITRAAAQLGISRNTLRYRIEKYGLRSGAAQPPRRRRAETSVELAPAIPASVPPEVPTSSSVRWERRHVTLLRAILVAPPDAPSPSDVRRLVDELVEKVASFGGRLEELSATGVVAAFGLEPVEDAPSRAALAAMAIQKAVEHVRSGDGGRITVAVGVHVDQFMVGRIGGTVAIDLDAKRQAWAVLEELVERAGADTIVVTEAAAPFLTRRFDLTPWGALEQAPGQIYRVAGRHRTGFVVRGRVTALAGRGDELELLRSRWALALRGQGQVVGIVGEPGIGKSRLLFEFRERLAEEPVPYLEGRCLSYGSAIPYLPVLDLLRQHCGITEVDAPEAQAEKVRKRLQAVGMSPNEGAPYLLQLLGVQEGPDRLAPLTPEAIKARTFETLRQLTLHSSRQRPLILAVEDLHWIDKTSEDYFASLVDSLPGAPMLLLCTYRPGYRPPWLEKSYATQMTLPPLLPEDSLHVVHAVLQTEQVAEPLAQAMLAKAEGNPFFLEELARVVGEHGDRHATLAVPDTIQGALMARLDRLPEGPKALLQTAAVLGRHVPLRLLEATWEGPGSLDPHLQELKRLEFLYEHTGVGETGSVFKHALTQEVTYDSLLPERRRSLHAKIVAATERLYADRLADQVERLGHHALQGEVWRKAVVYCRQAGARSFARSANREAVARFEQALGALQHLPEDRETWAQAIDLRCDLRSALMSLRELGRVRDHLHAAETLAAALGDQRRLGLVSAYVSQYFWTTGDQERAMESGQRALAIGVAIGDVALQVMTQEFLGRSYHTLGEYRRAIDFLERNIELLEGDLSREYFGLNGLPAVLSRSHLVWCPAELGAFAEGIVRGEEAVGIAEAVDHPFTLIGAYYGVGLLYLRQGDLSKAIPVLERGLALSQAANIPILWPRMASTLGAAYALAGRVVEALPLLEQGIEQATSMGRMPLHALQVAWLSEAYLWADRVVEALPLAQRALEHARVHKERGHEAWALRLLGEIAAQRNPLEVEPAADYYRQAMALAEALGMRPLLAHCHFGLGKCYRKASQVEPARTHLSTAIDLYHSMGMTFWLTQAQTELGQVP